MRSDRVPFRDVVHFAIGGGWGSEQPQGDDAVEVTVVRGTDFERARVCDLARCPRRWETIKRTVKRTLTAENIVLEISGGNPKTGQSTGRSLFVTSQMLAESVSPVIPASFCRRIEIDCKVAVPRYAYFLLQDMWQSGRARKYENQSTGIANFQFNYFLDEERVWLPDLKEQERIVAVLGSLDDKLDSNRRLAALLEETAAAIFKARFVDFVGVEEFEESEIGRVPNGWLRKKLGDLASVVKETIKPLETPDAQFEHFSIPAFDNGRRPDVVSGSTMLSGKTAMPPTDCVLLSKLNPHTRRVWWPKPAGYFRAVSSPEFIVLVPRQNIPNSFLYTMLAVDNRFYDELLARVTGTTGSRQRVKPADALTCSVIVPGPDVLNAWDRDVRPLYQKMHSLMTEGDTLSKLRDTLLPKLISGEIRVPDTRDPEEVIGPVAEELAGAAQ